MQANESAIFQEIPIDKGTVPNWEKRLNNPKLYNMFIGQMRKAYCTPWLKPLNDDLDVNNARCILKTTYNGGAYIVVTSTHVLSIKFNGDARVVGRIGNSGLPVQMDENLQNQVGIVDGHHFYVFDQRKNQFQVMGEDQGFTFTTPISITMVNSIAVVLDKKTGSWAISDPNQMNSFPALDFVAQISSSLTEASSLETLDDNLYIFGTTGIERWVPNSGNNPYLFPFAKDNQFRVDFGAIATNSPRRAFGVIYFLSSKYIPMKLTGRGTEAQPIGEEGMSRIIESYPDAHLAECSFYAFADNFFYHMYFPESNISWVYSESSQTWANGDDHIISCVPRQDVVATPNGLFTLTDDSTYAVSKLREIQTERIKNYQGMDVYRDVLNGVEVQMIQGFIQSSTDEPQYLSLGISLDSDRWLNRVPAYIGNTGERNALTIWRMNLGVKEFTLNIQYQGTYNFVIDKVTVILK